MKKKKSVILLGIIFALALVGSGVLFIILKPSDQPKTHKGEPNKNQIPTLKIIDETSKSRPIAVMINNHNYTRPYHSGLQDAFVVYEMIVEGGITRMMAVFKDQNTAKIGSVRSSRHNFLDYAMEYDAIYVHFGWSNKAKEDISSFKINNINGLYDSKGFWRDTSLPVATEHRAFTSMEKIKQVANTKKYKMTTDTKVPFHYNVFQVNLNKEEDAIKADKVSIPYSNYMTTSYEYDAEKGVYKRFANGKAHTDYVTKKQYTAKNIIVINVKNASMDSYGRQNLDTVGKGTGYYITNGYARKITWEKSSRSSQSIYRFENGEEIILNDGNTFVQIQPVTKTTTIKAIETSES